jgi:hypothetical protein
MRKIKINIELVRKSKLEFFFKSDAKANLKTKIELYLKSGANINNQINKILADPGIGFRFRIGIRIENVPFKKIEYFIL